MVSDRVTHMLADALKEMAAEQLEDIIEKEDFDGHQQEVEHQISLCNGTLDDLQEQLGGLGEEVSELRECVDLLSDSFKELKDEVEQSQICRTVQGTKGGYFRSAMLRIRRYFAKGDAEV